jgi:predicted ArsR family transcriptional regulator
MSKDRSPNEGEQTVDDDVHGTRWEQLLGTGAKPAMLLAFVANRNRDLNKTEIAANADVSEMTVHRNIDDLLELGVIEQTRQAGNAPMYQLTDSDLAGLLEGLDRQLIEDTAADADA